MLPQSSKKGISTLRQTTGRYFSHIIRKQIMSHFSKNKILAPVQHDFQSKHSCESQLLITTDEFIQNFKSKTQTDVVVLDFSQAFDVVSHQRLFFSDQ